MYITAVGVTALPGMAGDLGEHVSGMRDVIAQVTGKDVNAWAVLQGMPNGTFMISIRMDSYAEFVDGSMKLRADADYKKRSAAIGKLAAAPAETFNNRVIATAGDAAIGPFLTVTSAVMSPPPGPAMAWSVKMLELGNEITGTGGMLAVATAGNLMSVTWMGTYESAEQVDTAAAAIDADPRYAAAMDEAGGLFVDGSAQRMFAVRMP